MATTRIHETTFNVCRLTVPVPGVREFQRRYEEAVPDVPLAAVQDLLRRDARWSEMLQLVAETAPYEFLIYHRNDEQPVMRAAGNPTDCIAYLMGNHTIAERMFRHDPRAMLYAPLRTLIWEDRDGHSWFTADRPSSQFGSLGIPEVAEVGAELDRKLSSLLEALEVEVPAMLLSAAGN